jgi:hypothetical protein
MGAEWEMRRMVEVAGEGIADMCIIRVLWSRYFFCTCNIQCMFPMYTEPIPSGSMLQLIEPKTP